MQVLVLHMQRSQGAGRVSARGYQRPPQLPRLRISLAEWKTRLEISRLVNNTSTQSILRGSGIDINTTEDELTAALEDQLTSDEKGRYEFDTRLAPFCIELQSSQIATFRVTSNPFVASGTETRVTPLASETPSFLERERPSLDLCGRTIQIDPDFYGLTQLYHVPEDKIKIDALGTKLSCLRIMDRTTKQLKYCRTMVFGYDTKYGSKAQFWIEDYVNILLTELNKARRREEERKRPLVLMGHSFGGTVLTHAYVTASEDEKYKDLYDSITDIFFFGVPFASIKLDDVRSMLEDNKELSGQGRWIDGQGRELVNYIDYETARLTKTTRTFMKKVPENRTSKTGVLRDAEPQIGSPRKVCGARNHRFRRNDGSGSGPLDDRQTE
ncbi:hypothetical protein TWF569_003757 [Orbilia oligospora]|nr:hypothetical protein TWF569_003757 [Orbilia oligospora]